MRRPRAERCGQARVIPAEVRRGLASSMARMVAVSGISCFSPVLVRAAGSVMKSMPTSDHSRCAILFLRQPVRVKTRTKASSAFHTYASLLWSSTRSLALVPHTSRRVRGMLADPFVSTRLDLRGNARRMRLDFCRNTEVGLLFFARASFPGWFFFTFSESEHTRRHMPLLRDPPLLADDPVAPR
jgi:hypothetical protein